MKNLQPKFILVLTAILVATVFRMLPHWYNFTPMAAIALMGGALVSDRRLAFVLPLAAMLVSDYITVSLLNSYWSTPADYFFSEGTVLLYISFVLMTLIGFRLRNNQSSRKLAVSAIACSAIFFLLSNFGVFLINELPKTFGGLLATYALGIPFLAWDMAGSLFYTFVFFGLVRLAVGARVAAAA